MTSLDRLTARGNLLDNEQRQSRTNDPLPRLLVQLIERAGEPAAVEHATSRPWASALFQGRRHVIMLRISGSDAAERRARFTDGLEDAEWALLRHFVADISVDASRSMAGEEWIELSALTIEDW